MFEYNQEILKKLRDIPFKKQGMVGDNPSRWTNEMGIEHSFELPDYFLSREEVRTLCQCQETDLLKAYLIVMSWGAQGRGPGGRKYAQQAWNNQTNLVDNISKIKYGRLTREQEFNLFCEDGEVLGLGPSYFTKLLYFFSPHKNRYIMDQWTTKPVILLTRQNIIRHSDKGPTKKNTGKNYELFCKVIEDLVDKIEAENGDEVEQRLFSVGSIKRKPRGKFRQFIVEKWEDRPKLPRYNSNLVENILINETN